MRTEGSNNKEMAALSKVGRTTSQDAKTEDVSTDNLNGRTSLSRKGVVQGLEYTTRKKIFESRIDISMHVRGLNLSTKSPNAYQFWSNNLSYQLVEKKV